MLRVYDSRAGLQCVDNAIVPERMLWPFFANMNAAKSQASERPSHGPTFRNSRYSETSGLASRGGA
jgi:hypothetical protein